jgi:membrane fusion protein, multidrug efflux system
MHIRTLAIMSLLALVTACGGAKKDAAQDASKKPAPQSLLLVPEDLVEISTTRIASGPVISGSLQAKKQADLRAEVSAIVMQVMKDNGDQVKKGDLLVRLDDTTFRQAMASAQEAERAARQSFEQAERQYQRLKTLSNTGAVSTQEKEDAELRRNTAQSDLAAARARLAQDSLQLARTEVRAPFAGVVSQREASNGDTAQVGKALLKVIDPASIYFSGFVSADQARYIQVGQAVSFHINGARDDKFEGKIERINPVADSSTRQVGVQVAITHPQQLTVGTFAEGRVQAESLQGLTLPETSLVQQGDHTYAWRVQKGQLKKIEIKIGARDVKTGDYAIIAGLGQGDTVIRHPRGGLVDGANVEMKKVDSSNSVKTDADKKVPTTAKQEG